MNHIVDSCPNTKDSTVASTGFIRQMKVQSCSAEYHGDEGTRKIRKIIVLLADIM